MRKKFISSFGASALAAAFGYSSCSLNSEYRPNQNASTGRDYSSPALQQGPAYSAPAQPEPRPEPQPKKDLGYVLIPKRLLDPNYRPETEPKPPEPPKPADPKEELRKKIDFIETVYWQPQLSIYNGMDRIGVIASHEEVIRQLGVLARHAQQEDGWMEIPEADVVIDVGKPFSAEYALDKLDKDAIMLVKTDHKYADKFLIKNKNLLAKTKVFRWHIHPKAGEDIDFEIDMKQAKKDGRIIPEEEKCYRRFGASISSCLPSDADVISSIGMSTGTSTIDIDESHAVRSPYGSFIISLTETGKINFLPKVVHKVIYQKEGKDYRDKLWEAAGKEMLKLPIEIWKEKPESEKFSRVRLQILHTLCKEMSTDEIKLEFIGD